jgi:glycine dehydrogenase subunit 1
MRYFPHTELDIRSMLEVVGAQSLDELFSMVPDACRRKRDIQIPAALTEWELGEHLGNLARGVAVSPECSSFVGGGSYEHHIPEVVSHLISRGEFVTCYTPYQPEMSQGTLQAVYEYQTLITRLLGMEVANASMYDGASALAEAVLMAVRLTGRRTVALSRLVHPHHQRVVKTYLCPTGCRIIELPFREDGRTDLSPLDLTEELAAVVIQSPNFFGCIEDLRPFGDKAHELDGLFITSFTEPLAYGLLKSPGSQSADIACGEGQSLGIPQSFGGPGLGVFAGRMKDVRSMPGRLVGETRDLEGRRGFVLTLATREQHIRREKATSNICTNNSLCAVAAAMYMAALGARGIRELATLNHDKSEYLKRGLVRAGFDVSFQGPTFNEFVVKAPPGFESTHKRLLARKIVAGLSLAPLYPELSNHFLFCVTETKKREEMDALIREMAR